MFWVPRAAWVGWGRARARAWSRREPTRADATRRWPRHEAQPARAATRARMAATRWPRARARRYRPCDRDRAVTVTPSRTAATRVVTVPGPRRARAPAPAARRDRGSGFRARFLSCRCRCGQTPRCPQFYLLRSTVVENGETAVSPLLKNRGFLPVQIFGPFAEKPHEIGQGRTPESIVCRM